MEHLLLIPLIKDFVYSFNLHDRLFRCLPLFEKETKSVGLEKGDAMNRARWRVVVGEIAVRVG